MFGKRQYTVTPMINIFSVHTEQMTRTLVAQYNRRRYRERINVTMLISTSERAHNYKSL